MGVSTTLGSLISDARKRKALSQATLSAACGYPYNVVFKWEGGQSLPIAADWVSMEKLLAPELDMTAIRALLPEALINGIDDPGTHQAADVEAGHRIRRLREAAGFTATYTAEQLGIDEAQVARLESGTTSLTPVQLRKLSQLYSASYECLLDGKKTNG